MLPPPRRAHDHLYQRDNGVPGCAACESIDPERMTPNYAYTEKHRLKFEQQLKKGKSDG